jgi:hypothetical protein
MTVRRTSIEAYHDIIETGRHGKQVDQVLAFVRWAAGHGIPDVTRREISVGIRIEVAVIPDRVSALLRAERLVEGDKRKCSITGRLVNTVKLKPPEPVQGDLGLGGAS